MPVSASSVNRPKRKSALERENDRRSYLRGAALVVFGVLALDQLTKIWVHGSLAPGETISVLGDFFRITLVFNYGGAMGTSLWSSNAYLITSLLILAFVLFYLWLHRTQRAICFTLAFVAGGALGNIIDRVRIGSVIDFLDFDIPNIALWGFNLDRWWAFNIADAAITCSIAYLVIRFIFPGDQGTSSSALPSASESDSEAAA